ncbi:TolC family protein [Rufibacter sp. XAAS-G3-1]|uniref:TolC family protein n=1 Tax=Rufibacter sp. XAAS-G3-1 TaxID=2729134 RepID=UPI0015E62EF5|nr:TolC family protein [Rufibacter sp. XAAS-G3-1]
MHKVLPFLFTFFLISGLQAAVAQEPQKRLVSLQDLFRLADENNRTLRVGTYREQLAEEQIQQQKNQRLPSIEASLSFTYNGDGWIADRDFSNGMRAPIPSFGNNFALEATQVLYAGGAIKTSIEMAKLSKVMAQLDKTQDRQNIRFLLAGHYLELQKLQNQKQILRHNLQQTDKLLAQIKNKASQGIALKTAVTRFELQKQSYELALLKLENNEKIIHHELVETLQLPKGTTLEINPAVEPAQMETSMPAPWQSLAQENAPVLQQMQVQVQQAQHQETLARADKKPQVVAFAGDQLNGPVMIEVPPLDKNFNYWYAGVGLKYNLANLYKAKTNLTASKLSTQKTRETQALAQDRLMTEVETTRIRHQEAQEVYETQLKSVQLATENYTVVYNRYLSDLVLITEMLDARNAKLDAELQAANAQINILFHYYQLKKLTGTL